MIIPCGYRLLVKADPIETETSTGIVIIQNEKLERAAQTNGTVVQIGTTAWGDDTPWCKIGDRVCYVKHSGKIVQDPSTGEEFIILNDEDVLCIFEEEK